MQNSRFLNAIFIHEGRNPLDCSASGKGSLGPVAEAVILGECIRIDRVACGVNHGIGVQPLGCLRIVECDLNVRSHKRKFRRKVDDRPDAQTFGRACKAQVDIAATVDRADTNGAINAGVHDGGLCARNLEVQHQRTVLRACNAKAVGRNIQPGLADRETTVQEHAGDPRAHVLEPRDSNTSSTRTGEGKVGNIGGKVRNDLPRCRRHQNIDIADVTGFTAVQRCDCQGSGQIGLVGNLILLERQTYSGSGRRRIGRYDGIAVLNRRFRA